MIIGVTGGVGTGKTTILHILKEEFDAVILVADDIGRELMEPGMPAYENIVLTFGPEILLDGAGSPVDRNRLADEVFHDPEKLRLLNGIVHPLVKQEILARIAANNLQHHRHIVIESAILIEAGYLDMLDELWVIHTDIEVRRARLRESRNYSDEKTDSIIRNQMPSETLESMADFVIDNSRDLEYARRQIREHLMILPHELD